MPLLALLIALAAPPNGLADACASAAEKAEPLKKAGHFSEALSALERCVSNSCPKAVNEYCRTMKSELDLAQPTIEVSIQDEQLGRLMSARVMLDGVEKGWSAGALPVDPGVHQLHVELEGYVPYDEALGLRAGEKRRPVIVVMKPVVLTPTGREVPPTPPPVLVAERMMETGPSFPAWPMMVAGVGATASWATFIGLGLFVKNDLKQMLKNCAPGCDPTRTRELQLRAGIADTGLVLGSLLTALTTYFVIRYVLELPPPRVASN